MTSGCKCQAYIFSSMPTEGAQVGDLHNLFSLGNVRAPASASVVLQVGEATPQGTVGPMAASASDGPGTSPSPLIHESRELVFSEPPFPHLSKQESQG